MAEIEKIQPFGTEQYNFKDYRALRVYNRSDIGTAPNFDNPGINGLFEVCSSSETTGETGTKPFNGFGPILTMKTPDNIAMLQISGTNTSGFYIRGKQSANVTLTDTAWNRIVLNSGTWGISITGNAATATTWQTARTLTIGDTGKSVNGSTNVSYTHDEIGCLPKQTITTSAINFDTLNQSKLYYVKVTDGTNAPPIAYHGLLLDNHNCGTPFQLYMGDSNILYIYKRWYTSGAWTSWSKLSAGSADSVAWGNVTGKPSTYTPSSHTHAYMPFTIVTSSINFNDYTTDGIYFIRAGGNTNYATTEGNHGVLFVCFSIGTPFQLFLGDSSINYFRKRYYSGGAWSAWFTMGAAWS